MSNRFSKLIEEARSGSDTAAAELVETYQPHVIRAIRRKMAREIRSKFDSEDFAQAVWASFFRHRAKSLAAGSPEQLIGLLATMARNKVIDEIRRRTGTKKYGGQREMSLDFSRSYREQAVSHPSGTPSQHLMARERLEGYIAGLPQEHRRIVQLRLEGLTMDDIALRVNISERTVRRILKKLVEEK